MDFVLAFCNMNDVIHSKQAWKDLTTEILNPTAQPCYPRLFPIPSITVTSALQKALAQRAPWGDRYSIR